MSVTVWKFLAWVTVGFLGAFVIGEVLEALT